MRDDTIPFPIRGSLPQSRGQESCYIPWWLAEIAYEHYCRLGHGGLSLKWIAQHGGFGREELVALVRRQCPAEPDHSVDVTDMTEELDDLNEKYEIVRRNVVELTLESVAIKKDRDQLADALVLVINPFVDIDGYNVGRDAVILACKIIAHRKDGGENR